MSSYAARVTARWWAGTIAVLAIALSALVIGLVEQASHTPAPTDPLPIGSDSARALVLAERLQEADATTAVVLFTRGSERLSASDLAVVTARAQALPGATMAPVVRSTDGTAALSVVEVPSTGATEVGQAVTALRTAARADLPDGLTAQVTGPAAVQADLGAVFDGADLRLLLATAMVVAVLLLFTYRGSGSPRSGWGCPPPTSSSASPRRSARVSGSRAPSQPAARTPPGSSRRRTLPAWSRP